jgi:putative transposase
LTGACREYGIKIQYRPPATPRFGGRVERLLAQ